MHPSLQYLCSPNIVFTDQLYGDSMIKDIKDIQEINKISRNVSGGSGIGRGGRYMRLGGRGTHRGFTYGRGFNYDKTHQTKS